MNEDLHNQAALYALDMLDPDERAAFERELSNNPDLQALVDDLRSTTAQLAQAAPLVDPPASLKASILAAVEERQPVDKPKELSAPSRDPVYGAMLWVPWAVAAGLALVAGLMAVTNQRLLEARQTLDALKIADLRAVAEGFDDSSAVAVWQGEQQQGRLRIAGLPPTTEEQSYQIWAISDEYDKPVNAGVFQVNRDGSVEFPIVPDLPMGEGVVFAISLEPRGGSVQARGPIVLAPR
jgi:anti-sigma-K factor RskA